eukprot:16447512-Heterocapsa_arctica.AAC.1
MEQANTRSSTPLDLGSSCGRATASDSDRTSSNGPSADAVIAFIVVSKEVGGLIVRAACGGCRRLNR